MQRSLGTVTTVVLGAILVGLLGGCGATTGASTTSAPSSTRASRGSTVATTPATSAGTTTTTTAVVAGDGLPPLAEPTAAQPLTILEIGDSLGQDLGFGLQDELGSDPFVKVVQDAVGDTGLSRPDYYDWPAHLAAELQQDDPQALIVFVGGNDGQSFNVNGEAAQPFTPLWTSTYTARVATIMNEATSAGARVLWVGMPVMQNPVLAHTMQQLNAIYQAQSALHKGVTYFPSWSVFTNAAGQYTQDIAGPDGEELVLRDPDGVHIAGAGYDRLAQALIPVMNFAWGTDFKPPSSTAS